MTHDEAYESLNIEIDLIPQGASNRPGSPLVPTHITVHNTSNSARGADARMHAKYIKGPDARRRQVSWHFTVDDKRCIKHLPTNERAWHAGPGNNKSIGIEICEFEGIDMQAAIDRASLLTAVLMHALRIPRDCIVPHQHWTGKNCPHLLLRDHGGFDTFRDRVAACLNELQQPTAVAGLDLQGTALPSPKEDRIFGVADVGPADSAGIPTPVQGMDRMAQLERLVGQLMLENRQLRAALSDAQDNVHETD